MNILYGMNLSSDRKIEAYTDRKDRVESFEDIEVGKIIPFEIKKDLLNVNLGEYIYTCEVTLRKGISRELNTLTYEDLSDILESIDQSSGIDMLTSLYDEYSSYEEVAQAIINEDMTDYEAFNTLTEELRVSSEYVAQAFVEQGFNYIGTVRRPWVFDSRDITILEVEEA